MGGLGDAVFKKGGDEGEGGARVSDGFGGGEGKARRGGWGGGGVVCY